jgi:hypothetical protein
MNDQMRNSFTSVAPPIVASPAKRIQALTGDPDFMTSLARGLAVVQAFQERKRHLTIAQISHRTEIPRAAVRRCLHTLIKLGYATTDGRTYSLLPKVLTLGHAYLSSTPLAVSAQPYLDRMSEQLHEACNMATLEGDDILYIARSATTQRLISVDLSVGGRLPAYCTSMGRILLAALVHCRSGTGTGPALDRRSGVRRLWASGRRAECQHPRRASQPRRAGAALLARPAQRQPRPQCAVVRLRKLFDKRTVLRLSN